MLTDQLKKRLVKGRPMTTITLRIPVDVVDSLKEIAPHKGLVNNGAITNSGGRSLFELEAELWDHVMSVNVRGTWLMTRACAAALSPASAGP